MPASRGSLLFPLGTVACRQIIAKAVERLPGGDGRRVVRPRRIDRVFDELHLVYVARAVRKDVSGCNTYDEHRAGKVGARGIVFSQLRRAVDAQALRLLEVQEKQADIRIDKHIAPRSVHPVAVVVRNGKSAIVEDAHESGYPALVGAVGVAVGVGRRYEKHGATLNERAVLLREGRANGHLAQAVGYGSRFADVLESPHSVVVHAVDWHHSSRPVTFPELVRYRAPHG